MPKISLLPELTVPEGSDAIPILEDSTGTTKKIKLERLHFEYMPDASETDQGATGSGRSIKAFVDSIGGVKNATIRLIHDGAGNTTVYQLSTDETITDNLGLIIDIGAILNTDLSIRTASYKWTLSGGGVSEYYLELAGGGDPGISSPSHVAENDAAMTAGAIAGLAVGEWDWGDGDALGYSTVYVRLSDSADPDGKAVDYVKAGYTLTINGPFEAGSYQVFSGAGSVAGLRSSRPQWYGAVINDAGIDNAAAIMAALEAVVPQNGTVLMSPGLYYTATEITPVTEYYNVRWKTEGGTASIKWNGAVDATKAVFRATVTTATDFAYNMIEHLHFDANDRAGFAFVIEGWAGVQGNAAGNTFNRCDFNRGTVAGFVMGENAEPAVNDSGCSQNTFHQSTFGYSPYNLKINSINAYETTLYACSFLSVAAASNVIQHVRILYGNMTRLNDCEFTRVLPATVGHPHGASDNAYCVYSESSIVIQNSYSEEARFLKTAGMAHSYNDFSTVESVYTNDSNADANLEGMYFINATAGSISVKNASAKSGPTGTRKVILAAVKASLENVLLGNYGYVTISDPKYSIIDGIKLDGFESLLFPHNWNFQHWELINGASDDAMYWFNRPGTGAAVTSLRSTDYNVYGDYTMHKNVTILSTSWLVGVGAVIDVGPNTRPFTVVVSGRYDGTASSIPQIRLNNVTKADITVTPTASTFIVTAIIDSTGIATTRQYLDIGITAVGQYWIDTIVVVPGFHTPSLATAFLSAKNLIPTELTGAINWNPANLGDGAGETSAAITVTGAVLGDYVAVGAPYDLQDCVATGYVQAANTVEIRLQNESGGARDLANGAWKVRVIK